MCYIIIHLWLIDHKIGSCVSILSNAYLAFALEQNCDESLQFPIEEELLLAFWKSSDESCWYSGVSDTGWTLPRLYINENKAEWHLNYTLTVAPPYATGQKRNAGKKDEGGTGVATIVWEKLCQLNQEAPPFRQAFPSSLSDSFFFVQLTANYYRRVHTTLRILGDWEARKDWAR